MFWILSVDDTGALQLGSGRPRQPSPAIPQFPLLFGREGPSPPQRSPPPPAQLSPDPLRSASPPRGPERRRGASQGCSDGGVEGGAEPRGRDGRTQRGAPRWAGDGAKPTEEVGTRCRGPRERRRAWRGGSGGAGRGPGAACVDLVRPFPPPPPRSPGRSPPLPTLRGPLVQSRRLRELKKGRGRGPPQTRS
uniref:Proline-rich protein HaeIII subfamily 1-like n=1 Tax=Callorhinus ursinus TaxID=34884 RepID=A0A3Q7ND31_CALUR|nr:proline-rich protein HaeIII subfamily 1-like [Callorhinus ursinus]